MARKRMIDPNIWASEDFAKLSTLAKLVFIGMFSNADDEGRGKAKAIYLKSVLFPYDEAIRVIDVDKTLSEISSNMSVTFYSHDGNEYYSLYNWSKWQKVEKPQKSNIPEFDEHSVIIRGTVGEQSGNNRGTISPNRIEENKKGIEEKGKEEGDESPPVKLPPKIETIVEAYNSICINNPKVTVITDKRKEKLNTRLKEDAFANNYIEIFNIIAKTDFLKGENDTGWKADFDWVIENDTNYVKIMEGKYASSKPKNKDKPSNAYNNPQQKEFDNLDDGRFYAN